MSQAVPDNNDITQILCEWSDGSREALDKLMPIVYDELRRQASRYLRGERQDHTLQTTALVNEAYLRLIDTSRMNWQNRAHFFAVSANMMRRILVDFARSRNYQKRGGGAIKVSMTQAENISNEKGEDLVALDRALDALAAFDERKAKVVEMRFFGGLTVEETAEVLKVSKETVLRDWRLAKVWLLKEMSSAESDGP